ncbi:uncharacterized protein PpBr36_06306 [Pyricularia pennisetigena]|uniref:uncharacterized protein n=1 Tax=Pyricularia pennisetigena TaxID=1578925 RepID=UPI001153939C|nr:uncharacterized protein PpBr36_06306 [Pyricularia pennisetigena]TLS23060.1 hypothetical protein PpBr36_06306 [Pyricularia pennisetigena]
MNHKNWSDRADRDLFFTILSVKQIGVISGAEWQTIGSHMRTLGYGFTNEGCRQHFQGLRRAQNKAEANDNVESSPRRADPTLNPITRRPGPGRGRPRRLPGQSGETPTAGEAPVTPTTPASAQDQPDIKYHGQPQADPQLQVQIGDTHLQNSSLRHAHQQHDLHQNEPSQHCNQQQEQQQQQQHHQPQSQPQPMAMMVPLHTDGIDFGPHDPDDDDDAGHDIKRQRQESPTDPSLDDEAVLHALAAANGTGPVDTYSDEAMPMKWDDGAVAMLCGTIVAILGTDGITQDQKDAIVQRMNSAGYDVAWNGIRFEDIKGHLFEAIWRVTAPSFGPDQQMAVISHLKAKGIEMTWDAVRWDDKSDRDLLIAAITELTPTPEQMKNIVQRCHQAGYTFTVSAATQHLQKLKKKDPMGPSGPTPSTPKSKKTGASAAGSGAKSTSKRGRKPAKNTSW